MRRSPYSVAALGLVICALVGVGTTGAMFTKQTAGTANGITASTDFRAPTAGTSLIYKAQTPRSSTGYIKQGGDYRVYANVLPDTGGPPSGVATVTADVSLFSTGVTAAPMTLGTYTVAGVGYNYRSDLLTASSPISEGTKPYTLRLVDVAANSGTATGYSVVIDNTAPSAVDVQTTNSATAGRPNAGDKVVYTFSEPIDPATILTGWTGGSTAVEADVLDGGSGLLGLGLGSGNDVFTVEPPGGGTPLALTVGLGTDDYTYGLVLVLRTACDTPFHSSTMAMSGNAITVTLGGTGGCPRTSGAGTMTWAPVAGPTDRAGNALPTTLRNETGGGDADF